MTGDYHHTNSAALSKLNRFLRGDFDAYLNAPAVGGTNNHEVKETEMAKKRATGSAEVEQSLPGMEEETYPAAVTKAIVSYHEGQSEEADAKAETKARFETVKEKMHEHNLKRVKLRIKGNWKYFTLNSKETGKFEDVKDGAAKSGDGEG